MGTELLAWRKIPWKPQWTITFLAGLILGFFAHTYCFVNNLPCMDGLFNYYSSQDMIQSGRWLLSAVCGLSSWFCVPWCIGVLSLIFASLTAVVVTEIFQIRDRVLCVLTAGILVTFPSIANTFYFLFTADGYMIAMLLAALAVYLTPLGEARPWRFALAGVCLTCCCGIYQTYVCFAMVLALCYLIVQLLEKQQEPKALARWIGAQLLTYILSMACYYGIWKLILAIRDIPATSYRGISDLNGLAAENLANAAFQSVREFIVFFLDWDKTGYLLSPWSLLNGIFLVLAAITAVTALVRSGILARKGQLLLLLAAVCAIPFAVHIWLFSTDEFLSPTADYPVRMQQSMSLIYILVGVVCLRWCRPRLPLLCGAVLAVLVFFNSVNANIYYYQMERAFQKSYAAVIEMSARIHALDDGTPRYLAVEGELTKPSPQFRQAYGKLRNCPETLLVGQSYIYLLLENETGFQLSYYRDHPEELPCKEVLDIDPVGPDWTFRFPLASYGQLYTLRQDQRFLDMPVWPAADSVALIDDIVVVKLSHPEE